MRADGLWHPRLAALVAALGHTDTLVIADAGLPVPPGVERVELVWGRRQPRLLPVLAAVLAELVVEHAVIAQEADAGTYQDLATTLGGIPVTRVPHEAFKHRTAQSLAIVRTGEDTPFSNVLLSAGVPF